MKSSPRKNLLRPFPSRTPEGPNRSAEHSPQAAFPRQSLAHSCPPTSEHSNSASPHSSPPYPKQTQVDSPRSAHLHLYQPFPSRSPHPAPTSAPTPCSATAVPDFSSADIRILPPAPARSESAQTSIPRRLCLLLHLPAGNPDCGNSAAHRDRCSDSPASNSATAQADSIPEMTDR